LHSLFSLSCCPPSSTRLVDRDSLQRIAFNRKGIALRRRNGAAARFS
jgi:hypothetical protein